MNSDIADLLDRFVGGQVEEWEFDDLISSPWKGDIENFRLEILDMGERYPSDGVAPYCEKEDLERIKDIAKEILSYN